MIPLRVIYILHFFMYSIYSANVPRMEMFFHIGIYDYILFKEWVPQSLGAYFASLFVVFIMAVLGEGFLKHYLLFNINS